MEAASNPLGDYFLSLGGGVFDSTRFVPELSWQPLAMEGSGGYNHNMNALWESRGYCGAEVD